MATTTVSELIERAAAAADMEDNFVTPEQWERWATVEHRRLASVVARLGFPFDVSDETIALNGALDYQIDEPLAILGVYFLENNDYWRRLEVLNPMQQLVKYDTTAPTHVGDPDTVHIYRNTVNEVSVKFFPNPASGTAMVKVISHPAKLVISGPTTGEAVAVTYPLNWEERIVLGMARRALAKEETMNPFIEQQIREMDEHIESTAFDYVVGDAPRIRNVRDDNIRMSAGWMFI